MTKPKAGPIRAAALKSYVERIERLEEERGAIGGDIKDVYSEAKGVGYDVPTMRKIVQERRQDAADRDEQEALLDTYCHALGMPGATYRGVAEQLGVTKSKLHRLVPNESRGTAADTSPKAPDASSTVTARATESCGGVEGHALAKTGDVKTQEAVVASDVRPAPDQLAGRETARAGVESGPQDLIKEVAHELVATREPEVARVVPPVAEPVEGGWFIASQPTQLRGRAAQASQSEAKRTQ